MFSDEFHGFSFHPDLINPAYVLVEPVDLRGVDGTAEIKFLLILFAERILFGQIISIDAKNSDSPQDMPVSTGQNQALFHLQEASQGETGEKSAA